jgi:hypothetical protein
MSSTTTTADATTADATTLAKFIMLGNKQDEYIKNFKNSTKEQKNAMMVNFVNLLEVEKINFNYYNIHRQILKGTSKKVNEKFRVKMIEKGFNALITYIGSIADLSKVFIKTDLDEPYETEKSLAIVLV